MNDDQDIHKSRVFVLLAAKSPFHTRVSHRRGHERYSTCTLRKRQRYADRIGRQRSSSSAIRAPPMDEPILLSSSDEDDNELGFTLKERLARRHAVVEVQAAPAVKRSESLIPSIVIDLENELDTPENTLIDLTLDDDHLALNLQRQFSKDANSKCDLAMARQQSFKREVVAADEIDPSPPSLVPPPVPPPAAPPLLPPSPHRRAPAPPMSHRSGWWVRRTTLCPSHCPWVPQTGWCKCRCLIPQHSPPQVEPPPPPLATGVGPPQPQAWLPRARQSRCRRRRRRRRRRGSSAQTLARACRAGKRREGGMEKAHVRTWAPHLRQ